MKADVSSGYVQDGYGHRGSGEAGRRVKRLLYKYRHLWGYIIMVTMATDLKGGNQKI